MSNSFVFNPGAVRKSAERIEYALGEVSVSGYASCADCGSGLVADTVKLFVDEIKKAIKSEKGHTKRIAGAMEDCADDFSHTESANLQEIRQFLDMIYI